MATTSKVKVGQNVIYVSTKGYEKAAIVVNTPETVVAGKAIPELNGGQLHLLVFSLTNGISPRLSVPSLADIEGNSDFTDSEGKPIGYWKKA